MLRTATLLTLLAACGVDGPDPNPGRPDARPGLLDGEWNVTWTCESVCANRPDVIGTVSMTAAGHVLTFGGGPGGEIHRATSDDGTCLDVPGDESQQRRQPYRLCLDGTGAKATIAWLAVGPPQQPSTTWRLQVWR
jgi:hypothetical protein